MVTEAPAVIYDWTEYQQSQYILGDRLIYLPPRMLVHPCQLKPLDLFFWVVLHSTGPKIFMAKSLAALFSAEVMAPCITL